MGNPELQADLERFDMEFLATVPRYLSYPGAEININARHKETNEIIPFGVSFPEAFEDWRTVKSLADRRGIIYSILDTQFSSQLELWQFIERLNDDRYPQKALETALEYKDAEQEATPNFWNALARTNFILTNYAEALENCEKALALDADNIRTKRIYADVLHIVGEHERAHAIYREILNSKIPKNTPMQLALQALIGFDGDILNSPIYAISWLKADKNVTADTWEWANEEFYYSPHFRMQYAYHLIDNGEALKGFVKLLNLTKEMPWVREAVVNTYGLIDQMGLGEQVADEKARLAAIIEENNWS